MTGVLSASVTMKGSGIWSVVRMAIFKAQALKGVMQCTVSYFIQVFHRSTHR